MDMDKICRNCCNWCGSEDDQKAACILREHCFEGFFEDSYCDTTNCTDTCDEFEPSDDDAPAYAGTPRDQPATAVKLELGSTQTLARQNEDGEWELSDPPR